METLFNSLKAFLKEPFTTPMSFWQYSALVGLTMMIVVFWVFVTNELSRLAEEI